MAGIFERIAGLAGTELAKAVNLAHDTFQGRMQVHNHTGRALVETAAEVCRNHPNLVGIGAGLLVEQLLVEEKHRHDAHLKAAEDAGHPIESQADFGAIKRGAGKSKTPRDPKKKASKHKVHKIRPLRIAVEVFGALMLLKLGAAGAKLFRKRNEREVWFAPAARIHMFSAAIAAYNLADAIRSPKISAWRNGAVAFFGTAAIKPVLKLEKRSKSAPVTAVSAPSAPAAPAPTPPPINQAPIVLTAPVEHHEVGEHPATAEPAAEATPPWPFSNTPFTADHTPTEPIDEHHA
jgi:hypothetical protein